MSGPARTLPSATLVALFAVPLAGAAPVPGAKRADPAAVVAAKPAPAKPPAATQVPRDSAAFDSTAGDSIAPPRLYLSWRAPYGMPGATDTMSFGAGDTSRVDTLFLSFETGRSGPEFLGVFARLYFHPATGDTLGDYWRFGTLEPNARNLTMEFDPDGTFPCPQPWVRNGMGFPDFSFDPAGTKLDLYYVLTRLEDAIPVDGSVRYCFARVMFHQRRGGLPGATRPVCVDWTLSRFSVGRRDVVARRGGQRCVSINSPDGSVCAPYRRTSVPPNWVPDPWRKPNRTP